jgi:hypothetical protein
MGLAYGRMGVQHFYFLNLKGHLHQCLTAVLASFSTSNTNILFAPTMILFTVPTYQMRWLEIILQFFIKNTLR